MKKTLLLIIFIICAALSYAQQRIYNQTMFTVTGGIVTMEDLGWSAKIGIEQIIKSTNSSFSAEFSFQNSAINEDIKRNVFLFIPSYNYYFLTKGRFSSNIRLGLPIGVDNLKTPSYISYTPKDKIAMGIQGSLQFEYFIGKSVNIYAEGYYQYFFLSRNIINNPGVAIGLKFRL